MFLSDCKKLNWRQATTLHPYCFHSSRPTFSHTFFLTNGSSCSRSASQSHDTLICSPPPSLAPTSTLSACQYSSCAAAIRSMHFPHTGLSNVGHWHSSGRGLLQEPVGFFLFGFFFIVKWHCRIMNRSQVKSCTWLMCQSMCVLFHIVSHSHRVQQEQNHQWRNMNYIHVGKPF